MCLSITCKCNVKIKLCACYMSALDERMKIFYGEKCSIHRKDQKFISVQNLGRNPSRDGMIILKKIKGVG